ncbi:MAG: RnfABCDGE type electron transport complex subunit D [Leptolyngbyaceae cyanobacterium MAG.088]|nr:RnfABCDGE type electron transport complex subunit D [Leptolyngbyaceae cyanobacterium MAG.088]
MDILKVRSHLPSFNDARDYQILCLSLFLGLGVAMRDWSLQPVIVATAILTALVTQSLLSCWLTLKETLHDRLRSGNVEPFRWLSAVEVNWRSPLITALGLSLLLRTDHIATMVFATSVAIASKFLFKTNDKHFFNPANLGIIAALTLTNDAWVSPGQWGDEIWYGLIFIGAGGMVLKRVGRWDTTGMFLASYALLEAMRNLYLGWTWDVWAHRMMSGSLLLFALFMVTDPRSIPNARPARLIWALAIAGLTFVLRNQFYLSTAVFWALFALAPLTIVLDKLWESPRFEWKQFRKPQLSSAR